MMNRITRLFGCCQLTKAAPRGVNCEYSTALSVQHQTRQDELDVTQSPDRVKAHKYFQHSPGQSQSKNADVGHSMYGFRSALLDIELLNSGWKTCVPFVPNIVAGKVIKVYDGDTITVASRLYHGAPIYRFSVRLNGIDTPEMKSKDEEEKNCAHVAREALRQRIDGRIVELKNTSMEKYGRILADVYLGDENMNMWMLSEGYALPYDGGTKTKPESWDHDDIHASHVDAK